MEVISCGGMHKIQNWQSKYKLQSPCMAWKHTSADGTVTAIPDNEIREQKAISKKAFMEEIVAMAVMKQAEKRRYGNLQISLKILYLLGKNNYPDNIPDVLRVLNNYIPYWTTSTTQPPITPVRSLGAPGTGGRNSAVLFLKLLDYGASFLWSTNNSFFPAITCRLFQIKGHYQTHFPVAMNDTGARIKSNRKRAVNGAGGSNLVTGEEVSQRCAVIISRHNEAYINPNCVLLNIESTDHIFCDEKILTDIEPTTDVECLMLYSSGEHLYTQQKGKFGGFEVWYNPIFLANILSLGLVTEKYRVTLDSEDGNAFLVHITAGHVIKFIRVLRLVCIIPTLVTYTCLS